MAIHILNFSIDSPDATSDSIAEDLSINDIESISELVLEHVLGFENMISEHDEPDKEEGLSFEINKIVLFAGSKILYLNNPKFSFPSKIDRMPYSNEWLYSQFSPTIVSPPPRFNV